MSTPGRGILSVHTPRSTTRGNWVEGRRYSTATGLTTMPYCGSGQTDVSPSAVQFSSRIRVDDGKLDTYSEEKGAWRYTNHQKRPIETSWYHGGTEELRRGLKEARESPIQRDSRSSTSHSIT